MLWCVVVCSMVCLLCVRSVGCVVSNGDCGIMAVRCRVDVVSSCVVHVNVLRG